MAEFALRDIAPPPGQDGLVDRAFLAELEMHLGAGLTAEILADAKLALADRLLASRDATHDRPRLMKYAHDLVGLAGQVGLHALSHAARQVEQAAYARDPARLDQALARMGQVGEASLVALSALPASLAPLSPPAPMRAPPRRGEPS
ncbi:MAG: Hpt domain-containing protein [Pseudomonadota bacterium]